MISVGALGGPFSEKGRNLYLLASLEALASDVARENKIEAFECKAIKDRPMVSPGAVEPERKFPTVDVDMELEEPASIRP